MNVLFVVGYLLIVGGYYSDKSFSTYGIRETEVVDVLSDISEGCGIRAPYPDGIHPFETGGDMIGKNAVVCGGYCRNEDCGNGEYFQKDFLKGRNTNIFAHFLVQMKILKSPFQIN